MSSEQTGPDEPVASPPNDSLQFDRAEFAPNASLTCAFCKAPNIGQYYQINGRIACPNCRGQVEKVVAGGPNVARAARALVAGIGAGLAGFLVYWGIRAATGYEFALVAILVGWMVGVAVRWGAQQRGGLFYQLLAVALTYCAIASTYMPDIIQGMRESRAERASTQSSRQSAQDGQPAEVGNSPGTSLSGTRASIPFWLEAAIAFGFSLAAPFLMGTSNILGWIIMAVGLMQAWRLNKRVPIQITGPFQGGATIPTIQT